MRSFLLKSVYFVGIGGSGMCGLASIAISKGYVVYGSDASKSKKTDDLVSRGAKIYIGHSESNIFGKDIDVLVYSGAISDDNPELVFAKKQRINCISRSKFLGTILSEFENSLAVAGSHGKSTTTAMVTSILMDSGKDPTSIIGAEFSKIDGNSLLGNSDIAVCEACEFLDSFLDLNTKFGVILNIDDDHLDYFKTLENEKRSFFKFASKCKKIVINKDDNNSFEISKDLKREDVIYYGLSENSDFYAKNIKIDSHGFPNFDVFHKNEKIFDLKLKIPGKHNILNSLASIASCSLFNVDYDIMKKSIEEFSGVDRRFKFVGDVNGIEIFDDYAHHPTEIKSVLETARSMGYNNIWTVFQPHTFSRTYLLLDEFAAALSLSDHLILTNILPVREKNIYGITSAELAKKIKNSIIIDDFNEISDYLKKNVKSGDIILNMGAGTISECADIIYQRLLQQ